MCATSIPMFSLSTSPWIWNKRILGVLARPVHANKPASKTPTAIETRTTTTSLHDIYEVFSLDFDSLILTVKSVGF